MSCVNAPTTAAANTSSSYYFGAGVAPTEGSLVATGVAASVVSGAALAALILTSARFFCAPQMRKQGRASDTSPFMTAWKAKANNAFPALAIGIVFQSLGLVTGLAAPVIPWLSWRATIFGGDSWITFTTLSYTAQDHLGNTNTGAFVDFGSSSYKGAMSSIGVLGFISTIGTSVAYGALCTLVLLSLLFAWLAACRVSNVSKWGAAPSVKCSPGMPVIQGLSWMGTILFS